MDKENTSEPKNTSKGLSGKVVTGNRVNGVSRT